MHADLNKVIVVAFRVMMDSIRPFFGSALVAGTFIALGLEMIIFPAAIALLTNSKTKST
jgi:hypothetical protein